MTNPVSVSTFHAQNFTLNSIFYTKEPSKKLAHPISATKKKMNLQHLATQQKATNDY